MQGVQINWLTFYGEKALIKLETLSLAKVFICKVESCLVKRSDEGLDFSKMVDEVAPLWSI